MSESKLGVGQHRSSPGQVADSGQRTTREPGAYVGPNLSGGERQNTVPAGAPDGDINMTHGAAENDFDRANRHGKA
jgi:hypothetical protein